MIDEKFDKPLDQDVTEYKEVERVAFDYNPTTKQIRPKVVKEKVGEVVRYTKGELKKLSCERGKHEYFMEDRHRHIAACKNCPKHLFLRAAYETIISGQVINRNTKELID